MGLPVQPEAESVGNDERRKDNRAQHHHQSGERNQEQAIFPHSRSLPLMAKARHANSFATFLRVHDRRFDWDAIRENKLEWLAGADSFAQRSEERRVGKECRSGWRPEY